MIGKYLRLIFVLVALIAVSNLECDAQRQPRTGGNTKRNTFIYKLFHPVKKADKPEGPRSATKAIRKQQKAEAEKEKAYNNFVKQSKKRALEIQTPKVQERLKQNQKEVKEREKTRKRNNKANTKKGSRKYD